MLQEKLRELGYRLRLTRNEQNVLFFLALIIVGGMAVSGWNTLFRPVEPFDYRTLDQRFTNISERVLGEGIAADSSDGTGRESGSRNVRKPLPAEKIDLNTASTTELTALPGVGPATAERIVAYRDAHGPFLRIEDITRVKSIGEKKFQKMKEFITVR